MMNWRLLKLTVLVFLYGLIVSELSAQTAMPGFLSKSMEKLNKTCGVQFDLYYEAVDQEGNVSQQNKYHYWKNDNDFLVRSEIFDCVKNDEALLFVNHQFESIYLIVKDELVRRTEEMLHDEFQNMEQTLQSYQFPIPENDLLKDSISCSAEGDLKFRCTGVKKKFPIVDYEFYDENHVKIVEIEHSRNDMKDIVSEKYIYSNYDSTSAINGNLFQVDHYLEMRNGELTYILDPNYSVQIKIQ